MAANLSAEACLLGVLGPWGSFTRGELRLQDDVISFTVTDNEARRLAFSAPTSAVKIRFPWYYFGLGLKVIADRKRHRVWFVRMTSAAGDTTADGQTIAAGNKFDASELGKARSITREWRTVLAGTGT